MKKLLLILLCLPMIGFGQNVYIPDAIFKAYLVGNTAINTNGDTEIQVSEATAFNYLIDCHNMNIYDLTGIETFTNLWELRCSDNQLTSLDVSANTALWGLSCGDNQLTSIDVSAATVLFYLWCQSNQLTSLDVSQNTALAWFDCSNNQLTSLDVSTNTALTELWCWSNQLTSLDVSNNTALITLHCHDNQLTSLDVRNGNNNNMLWWDSGSLLPGISASNNPYLNCINVDDSFNSNANWLSDIDPQQYYSNNCPPSAIEEHTTNKELLKTTDLLGRETKNQPLFYIYDDGTVEKRIVIE